ncbi:MAG: hypothetical protein ACUVSX_03925 [Aggregatilineales bacterium]
MPDTTAYLILGLVVTFGILGFYVASLVVRHRSLKKDLRLIEQLRDEQ